MKTGIKAHLGCLLAGILLLTTTYAANAQQGSAVATHGKLHVADGQVLNQNNEPPQLRGISLSWSVWGGRKYYNPKVVNWLADDFNISLLRVSMAVEPDSGYLKDPSGQEKLVTKVIDSGIKKGLYILIDWHDHHANKNVKQSKAFFSKMAKKYAGVPNVIYEVWNEPEKESWDIVKTYAIQVIDEIRKYDKDNLIVVGSPSWDQHVDVAAKDPIKDQRNIAYSFHFYASDPNHQEGLMARADEAIRLKLPLFVTEWGVGESNGDGVFDVEKNTKWIDWMERNKLSWANWNLTDKKETTAILMPAANINGGWKTDELTPAGQYIRKQLLQLNMK